MSAQHGHVAALLRNAAVRVECAEFGQQCPRGGDRAGRGLVRERQAGRQGAPGSAVQHQRRQLGLEDFRAVVRRQAAMQRGGPQADRHARGLAPCPAGALLRRGTRDAQRGQAGQAGAGVQPGRAPPAAIHHDAHAGHGQRGLGDRGRQHDAAGVRGAQRAVLGVGRQLAVQRQHQGAAALQGRLGAADFGHAGEEGEDVSGMVRQRGADGAGQGVGQVARLGDVAGGVADGDRKHAAGAFHDFRAHQGREAGAIGGGGHRKQTQFGAQHGLQVEAECQGEVGFQRALVDFVQDDRGDAIQARIGLQAAHEQPLGDDFYPRVGGDGGVQPRAEADSAAELFTQQRGHARGGGPGGKAARLQHQDFAAAAPGGVQQGQGDERGLAGAGRGDQHGVASGGEVAGQRGQHVGNRKVGQLGHARVIGACRDGVAWELATSPGRPVLSETARLLREGCSPLPLREGVGGRGSCRAPTPPPNPLPQGEGEPVSCWAPASRFARVSNAGSPPPATATAVIAPANLLTAVARATLVPRI